MARFLSGARGRGAAGVRALAVLLLLVTGCAKPEDTAAPVATPSVTLGSSTASIGGPVDVTYRFSVAADAPAFADAYTVFVHMVDDTGEILWTDDHEPSPSTREWNAGRTVEYTRTMFVPRLPDVGPVRVQVGLYRPQTGERLPLAGTNAGMRAYEVARLDVAAQPDASFVVFQDGWHDPEVTDGGRTEWQWSRGRGTLRFRNPRRDAVLLLQLDQPTTVPGAPQHVTVTLGETVLDGFDLPAGRRDVRRIALPAAQLGDAESVEIAVAVDRTFVPAAIAAMKSVDSRELGVRVFRAYVATP